MSGRVETIKIEKALKKKRITTIFDKKSRPTKNSRRQIRRKRSKIRYHKTLKKVRYNQKNQDLCSAVELFDISDMDWASSSSPPTLPQEILEWQRQDQIAYWKSRAISMEYENQMLKQHLRNVYAQTIEEYSQSKQLHESDIPEFQEPTAEIPEVASEKSKEKTTVVIDPNTPNIKQRVEEMNGLYGEKAQKIMGMETALQLNYERHLEHSKPVYWPSLPFKLNYDS
ncbi:hypothetical protein JTB14_021905 [Gonioctena quinquepunctata]|nr:hypothetical protein JTB14_021905 [Gonioctena quinquepunctata]